MGAEDWYDATVVEPGKIRIRTLKENTGADRTAEFTLNIGRDFAVVTVTQQGLASIGSVTFGSLEWMDRPLGATLRSSQAYANDIRSLGYYYQWGRSVPFPVQGAVTTVSNQMTPTEAMASTDFIAYSGGTQDWNSQGVEGNIDTYWETVTENPCPAGWRLPTYEELSGVLLYRNNSLWFANGKQSTAEQLGEGRGTHGYVGYGSGAITEVPDAVYHYGIKHQGAADAYYVRYWWINQGGALTSTPPAYTQTHKSDTQTFVSGGQSILRIDRIAANASANLSARTDATSFWADHEMDGAMQTLVFPCGGRRDATGAVVEAGNAAFYWSRSMFSGSGNQYSKTSEVYASGLLYFRPAGRYAVFYAPAYGSAQVHADTEDLGYRNQAMQIRCVKQ